MMARPWTKRAAPALLLAFLAPVMAELLPGATRFSSIFVFPVEMAVWGGGAVLIRALVRSRGLGWWSLLLLGLALAVAEECLIQQTSLAPLVIQLKGETWARAFGVNYAYLIWALVYESVWVVLLPVLAVELIFPARRREPWLGRTGAIVTFLLFLAGALLAWLSWTQFARTQVFHQPPYTPPPGVIADAVLAIVMLGAAALRIPAEARPGAWRPLSPPLIAPVAALWAILWYGLVLLAFGIAPRTPPVPVVAAALALTLAQLVAVPRWAAHPSWSRRHAFALLAGALLGSMAISFVGFIGAARADLLFKMLVDLGALAWLVWLGRRITASGADAQ
jgi:hypothetical protein